MNILFMGTPAFAVPSLCALVEAGHSIVGVFTQPDKPKNRGMKLQPPPVKSFALSQDIPVFQPDQVKEGLDQLKAWNPELIVVAAYGKILPKEILDFPPFGCINVHSSLLPAYRGAAPIHWAILNGDAQSGVTIMHMAQALDAGDIIKQAATPIDPNETVGELHDRLAELGAELLIQTVAEIKNGTATRLRQNEAQVTFAPRLGRELSPIDWARTAREIHNQVRGLTPWPAATAEFAQMSCKICKTTCLAEQTDEKAGTVLASGKDEIKLACGQKTVLRIDELQAPGGKRMRAADFLRGHKLHH